MPGMTPIQRIKSIIKRKEHIIVDLSKKIKKRNIGCHILPTKPRR